MFAHRLAVLMQTLAQAISAVYTECLPKHTHPFVYLGIELPARHVDVNVHPTKSEVRCYFAAVIMCTD